MLSRKCLRNAETSFIHGICQGIDTCTEEVKKFFAPEFRNRLDGTIKFNKLDKSIMRKIVIKFIDEINELMIEKGLHITISESAVEELAKKGYEPSMGARPLKRLFETELKKPLSKRILFEDLRNCKLIVNYADGEISFANIET